MATREQLKDYDDFEREHEKAVEAVKADVERSLSLARAQLAASIDGSRPVSDITTRDGFDPDHPERVLLFSEISRLPEATVIVDALRGYVSGTLRLMNARGPRVHGNTLLEGQI